MKLPLAVSALLLAGVLAGCSRPLPGHYVDNGWPGGRVDTWEFTKSGDWSQTTVIKGKLLTKVTGIYKEDGDKLILTWQHLFATRKRDGFKDRGVPDANEPEEMNLSHDGRNVVLSSPIRGRLVLHPQG